MLKSPLNQPRSSQVSPSWHYAAPSPRPSPRISSPRRTPILKSKSATSYVDASTQWSPRTHSHPPRPADVEPESNAVMKSESGPASTIAIATMAAGPLATSQPSSEADSPSMKRRKSQEGFRTGPSSTGGKSQTLASKRPRSAQTPVKILPLKYEFCDVEDMVVLIANMISELIQTNDGLPLRSGVLTRFHSRTPPGISVMDYLHRLAKHATLTPPLLLSMVYYIDRLCSLYPAFTITTLTVHRFLITAATVAAKGLSDSFWNNATYARVGGVKVAELGLLELDFLYRVDWRIVPNPEVLVDYYRGLVERSEGYELESDDRSANGEEDKELSEDDNEFTDKPQPKAEAATDVQWKAWMEDVSSRKAGSKEADGHKET